MFRIVSFNIRNGRAFDGWNSWPFRRRATAAAISRLEPDIVGLQEVYGFQLRWLRRRLDSCDVVATGRGASDKGESCPVFARREAVKVLDSRTRWYGPTVDVAGSKPPGAHFPRIATTCHMQLAGSGAAFTVTNTHFDSKSAQFRLESARQLVEWLDLSTPNIVVGDLNSVPDSEVLAVITSAGLVPALPVDAGGTNHRFTGKTDGRRLDHILVSKHFEVARGWVSHERPHNRLPSDHWPVAADLELR